MDRVVDKLEHGVWTRRDYLENRGQKRDACLQQTVRACCTRCGASVTMVRAAFHQRRLPRHGCGGVIAPMPVRK